MDRLPGAFFPTRQRGCWSGSRWVWDCRQRPWPNTSSAAGGKACSKTGWLTALCGRVGASGFARPTGPGDPR